MTTKQIERPAPQPSMPVGATGQGDRLPEATPAAADFICWLWAAFRPNRDGNLPTTKAAQTLGVSPSTVRRWVRDPDKAKITRPRRTALARRAILRGRGHYLWPEADPNTVERSEAATRHARAALANLHEIGPTQRDRSRGILEDHTVYLLHYRHAHVYGLLSTRGTKHLPKAVRAGADVIEQITVPNEHAAIILKADILKRVGEARCIAPRALVPTGRTETWRETAGPVKLTTAKRRIRAGRRVR